jgi:EamA-like transporter family
MKQVSRQSLGVLIAITSSCVGGTAAAVTRYMAENTDPLTLAILRWSIGFLCVLPVALVRYYQTSIKEQKTGFCLQFGSLESPTYKAGMSDRSDRSSPGRFELLRRHSLRSPMS